MTTSAPSSAALYFPREPRYGMPDFTHVLNRVLEYYRDHREELRDQGKALVRVLQEMVPPPVGADEVLDATPLAAARRDFAAQLRWRIRRFWRRAEVSACQCAGAAVCATGMPAVLGEAPDLHALYMATLPLRRMGEGGLNDQLGGGFCRYSVDQFWMIPHFEKMLYGQWFAAGRVCPGGHRHRRFLVRADR